MNDYVRVLPRDLFNEAKLLKCLGRLSLLIHDNVKNCGEQLYIEHEDIDQGFIINQNQMDGSIYCQNLNLYHKELGLINLSTSLNSREKYPLWFCSEKCGGDYVFNYKGKLTIEFITEMRIENENV